jgi:antirestriction protein ArdC
VRRYRDFHRLQAQLKRRVMHNPYLEVTLRILTELKAGVVPWWRQPWSATPGRKAAVDYLHELALREPAQAAE